MILNLSLPSAPNGNKTLINPVLATSNLGKYLIRDVERCLNRKYDACFDSLETEVYSRESIGIIEGS